MNTSTTTQNKSITRRSVFLGIVGAALVAVFSLLAFSPQAKAADFNMEITNAKLNLGFAFKNTSILPAPNNIGGSPLPDLWQVRDTQSTPGQGTPPNSLTSFKPAGCLTEYTYRVVSPGPPPLTAPNDGEDGRPTTLNPDYPCGPNPATATISGSKDESGNISVPASGFRFPVMVLTSPLDGSPVPTTFAATGELTGEMNNGNGEMSLTGPMEARVLLLTAPQTAEAPIPPLQSYCSVPLPGLTLSTGVSTPASVGFVGTPFSDDNPEGVGGLTGTWNIVDDAIGNGNYVYGDPAEDRCARVSLVVKNLGGVWLGAGIESPPPYPECEPPQTGTWPNCVDPTPFAVSAVKVTPAKKTVKAGQKVKLTVRVTNSGETAGSTAVSVKLSNRKGFSLSSSSFNVAVGAESSATRTVTVSTTRKAKGKHSVATASAGGKSGKSTIKVRR